MYLGNPKLRKEAQKIDYNQNTLEEYTKCREDVLYFAQKYFYIITLDKGRQLIRLWEFQKKMLKALAEPPNGKRHVIILASRQIGKCVCKDTKVKIRNKKTGKIDEIDAESFYTLMKNNKS